MSEVDFKNNWQRKKILKSKEHQYKAFEEINELVISERQGKKVTLVDGTQLTEFLSCSYLGLDQDERVVRASMDNIFKCGVNFPVARTRMKTVSFVILEKLLNQIFCDSYSTLFSSLHVTHLGVLPLLSSGEMPSFPLTEKGPRFILDKTVHASIQIQRGTLSQFGEIVFVDYRKLDRLKEKILQAADEGYTPIAISDGLGSMGGACSTQALFELLEKYKGYAYLDDAHGTSIFGKNGCGYVLNALGNQFHPRLMLAASLSKGFGTNGAIILVPTKADEKMIKRFANTYLFGNPLPQAIVDSAIASAKIHLSPEIIVLQKKLQENIAFFDTLLSEEFSDRIINYRSRSPIRGIKVGDEFKAILYSSELKKRGLMLSAAMYPTVEKGHSILRVAISADHLQKDIEALCKSLREIVFEALELPR